VNRSEFETAFRRQQDRLRAALASGMSRLGEAVEADFGALGRAAVRFESHRWPP
jgi:hypothetical protein